MKKKLIEKLSKKIFSDPGLRISKEKAKEIIDILYTMDLDATALQSVIYRLESYIYDSMLADIIDSLDKTKLEEVVKQIAVEIMNPCFSPEECAKQNDYAETKVAWLFSAFWEWKQFAAGDMVDIQIMREGTWNHPNYWEIEIDSDTIRSVKKNFDENKRGIELAVDENHEDDHKALWRFRELYIVWDGLFAKIELTVMWAELLSAWAYKYFSPEIIFKKVDEETGEVIENLLVGGAFTNRPFFKLMDPIMANEVAGQTPKKDDWNDSNQYLFIFKQNATMNKFMELVKKFGSAAKLTKDDVEAVKTAFSEIPADDKNARLTATYQNIVDKFEEPAADADEEEKEEDKEEEVKDEEVKEEDKKDEEEKEEDKEEEVKDELDADGNPVVKASEQKEVTIKASELDALKKTQSDYARLVADKRKELIASEVAKLTFSATEKTGIFTAKDSNKIVEFAASLSEVQAKKFFEIMGTAKMDLKKFTEELGSGTATGTKAKANSAAALEEKANAIMSEKGIKKSEAMKLAAKALNFSTEDENKEDEVV